MSIMNFIRTVQGDRDIKKLGICQCHEHLFIEMDKSYEISPTLYMDSLYKSTNELRNYKISGGDIIVDAQPVFAGRMAEHLIKASAFSGVHIIASTGFHKIIFYYDEAYIFNRDEQYITDLYIDEITTGMVSSKKDGFRPLNARAGIIKTAVDSGGIFANQIYEKLFAAAANAALATGAPILCHVEQGADAHEVARFFMDRGLAANRLILCHLDRARYDFAYHKEVLQTGVYLEYDTINRLKYLSNEQEVRLICAMLEAGFEDRLLLSLDTTNQRLRAYGADMGLDYIMHEFVPQMKSTGIPDQSIYKMQSHNAKEALKIKF